ncbi:MAG: MazG family protein [Aurantimicrobium sp.]|nr:MazG family protein [Aurantimicrobium sp.]
MASESESSGLSELTEVIERLRAEGGCPWCSEQTHESLVQYLVEETYELIEAIEAGDRDDVIEELGDVLYQVMFHASLAASTPTENYTLDEIARRAADKMIGRHPHVFGDVQYETADDVIAVWEELKKADKPGRESTLDGVPQTMPALALADKLLGKAAKLDLIDIAGPAPFKFESEDELGPLLMAIVASARAQGLDSERALRGALRELQIDIREAEATDAD